MRKYSLNIEKFTDVCMTGVCSIPPVLYKRLHIFQFSTYIFSADITPEILKLCRLNKIKVFSLVLVHVFIFDLFEFLAVILEKSLLEKQEQVRME